MQMKSAIRSAVLAAAIGSLVSCDGSPTPPTPTPTPTPTPANIAGSYDLTLIASSTCSQNLPPATRNLKYIANVTQTGSLNTLFIVTLSANSVVFGEVVISGGIIGQELKFGGFSFSEQTTGGGIALVATGAATVAADGSINGLLNGIYLTPSGASCNSTVHQIQMVKRPA